MPSIILRSPRLTDVKRRYIKYLIIIMYKILSRFTFCGHLLPNFLPKVYSPITNLQHAFILFCNLLVSGGCTQSRFDR